MIGSARVRTLRGHFRAKTRRNYFALREIRSSPIALRRDENSNDPPCVNSGRSRVKKLKIPWNPLAYFLTDCGQLNANRLKAPNPRISRLVWLPWQKPNAGVEHFSDAGTPQNAHGACTWTILITRTRFWQLGSLLAISGIDCARAFLPWEHAHWKHQEFLVSRVFDDAIVMVDQSHLNWPVLNGSTICSSWYFFCEVATFENSNFLLLILRILALQRISVVHAERQGFLDAKHGILQRFRKWNCECNLTHPIFLAKKLNCIGVKFQIWKPKWCCKPRQWFSRASDPPYMRTEIIVDFPWCWGWHGSKWSRFLSELSDRDFGL